MKKSNGTEKKSALKVVGKEENPELKSCREVIEKYGLDKMGMMVCGELKSAGEFLSEDHPKEARVETLILESLYRLSLVTTMMKVANEENSSILDSYSFEGVDLAVNEVFWMLKAASSLFLGD